MVQSSTLFFVSGWHSAWSSVRMIDLDVFISMLLQEQSAWNQFSNLGLTARDVGMGLLYKEFDDRPNKIVLMLKANHRS